MVKQNIVIFDLDGTLVEWTWFPSWDAHVFEDDRPIEPMCAIAREWAEKAKVVILTARPECVRESTEQFLDNQNIPYSALIMRPDGDRRLPVEYKAEVIDSLRRKYKILGAYDDDLDNIKMLRGFGIRAYEVIGDMIRWTDE